MTLKKHSLKGFSEMARRENFSAEYHQKHIPTPPTPWEAKGLSVEDYFADTVATLSRAVIALNEDPESFIAQKDDILNELSKVILTSGHFLTRKETDKINSILALIHREVANEHSSKHERVDSKRDRPSS
jgi:hypothetical protein